MTLTDGGEQWEPFNAQFVGLDVWNQREREGGAHVTRLRQAAMTRTRGDGGAL